MGSTTRVFCWQNFLPIQIMTTPHEWRISSNNSIGHPYLSCWETRETTHSALALYTAFPRGLRYHLWGSPSVVPEGNWKIAFCHGKILLRIEIMVSLKTKKHTKGSNKYICSSGTKISSITAGPARNRSSDTISLFHSPRQGKSY